MSLSKKHLNLLTNSIVLITGNGFDLHLNLESKMSDFFTRKILTTRNEKYFYNGSNLLYALIYYRFFAHGTYDYGVFRRVDNNSPSWMDVEGFIKKIATDSKIIQMLTSVNKDYANNDRTKSGNVLTDAVLRILFARSPSKSGAFSVIHKLLLDDLLEFEDDFKKYMKEVLAEHKDYDKNKDEFIRTIIRQSIGKIDNLESYISLFNFNYTSLASSVEYSSNVHGSLDTRIVIGYDSTTDNHDDKDHKDDIYELSKDWQKVGIDESDIDLRLLQSDSIIFYGHSLGEQDYPYFFEIFDQFKILESKMNEERYLSGIDKVVNIEEDNKVRLYFCYSPFGSEDEQRDFLLRYQIAISKLLNSYENYKRGNTNRNTIVTKLNTQCRLKLVKIVDERSD